MAISKTQKTTNPVLEDYKKDIQEKEVFVKEQKRIRCISRNKMDKNRQAYLRLFEQYSGNTYLMSAADKNIFEAYKSAKNDWNNAGDNIYSASMGLFSEYLSYRKLS